MTPCEIIMKKRRGQELKLLEGALHISQEKPMPRPLIHRVIE